MTKLEVLICFPMLNCLVMIAIYKVAGENRLARLARKTIPQHRSLPSLINYRQDNVDQPLWWTKSRPQAFEGLEHRTGKVQNPGSESSK